MFLSSYNTLKKLFTWTDFFIVVVVFIITWFIYHLFIKPAISPLSKIPGERGHLLFGYFIELYKNTDTVDLFLKKKKKFNTDLFRVHNTFGTPGVVVNSIEAYKHVTVLNNKNYPKHRYEVLLRTVGDGLVTLNGNEHAIQRKLCMSAFKYSFLKSLAPKFSRHARELVQCWDKKFSPDESSPANIFIHDDLERIALEAIIDTVFDLSSFTMNVSMKDISQAFNNITNSICSHNIMSDDFTGGGSWSTRGEPSVSGFILMHKLCELAELTSADVYFCMLHLNVDTTWAAGRIYEPIFIKLLGTMNIFPFYKYIPTPTNRTINYNKQKLDTIIQDMIETKRATMQNSTGSFEVDDLATMLILAEDEEDGKKLTTEQLIAQLLTFIFAGHETTTTSLTWCLHALASHPSIQEKARDEILAAFSPDHEVILGEDLDSTPYLMCVIKESLRYNPTIALAGRVCLQDDYICGHFVPKGTEVVVPISNILLSSDYWEEPEKFIPERFLDETKQKPFSFIPFTSGPRMCIGYKFALMEMQIILIHILRKYRFELTPGMENVKRFQALTLKPKPPVMLKVTKL